MTPVFKLVFRFIVKSASYKLLYLELGPWLDQLTRILGLIPLCQELLTGLLVPSDEALTGLS